MFLKNKSECKHNKVNPEVEGQYCSDCGKYIENKWYLIRCACCNVKRKAVMKHNILMPASRFCQNCGAEGFYVEHVRNINFIDIDFAVLRKEIVKTKKFKGVQSWIEREQLPIRLLGLNLCKG